MKVGLYFGSFNPVHHGHLIIAQHIINQGLVSHVWFVISPLNPLKRSSSLLNEHHRKFLVDISIGDDMSLKSSSIEFNLPKPSYTIDTLHYLKEKFMDHEFSIIMGSDSYQNLPKWKNYELLMKENHLLVFPRKDFQVTPALEGNITMLDAPLIEISSTQIRSMIKKGESIRFLVPERVKEEIERNGYYR